MALSSPVVEWRASTSPYGTLSSLVFTGSGSGGAVPLGTTSNPQTVRIYNNFAAAANIADANNCTLAAYDDEIHQGNSTTIQVTQNYLQVQVLDYNGTTTNADSNPVGIGGSVKHPVPVNNGTLSGTGANFFTVLLQFAVPASAPASGTLTEGVWLEFSSSA